MTAAALRIQTPATLDASWPSDDCCDSCCATPVREVIDGDKLCQDCADKWARGQEPDEGEIAELHRSLRHAGVYRGAMIEARLSDAELVAHSMGQRKFGRENRS